MRLLFSKDQIIRMREDEGDGGGGVRSAISECRDCSDSATCLMIEVKNLFSLSTDDPPVQRWHTGSANLIIPDAGVSLARRNGPALLQCLTNDDGIAYFDVAGLSSGDYTIELTPPAGHATGYVAGPYTASAGQPPDRLFRPATIRATIVVDGDGAYFEFATAEASGVEYGDNARVFPLDSQRPQQLLVDWKPDFLASPFYDPRPAPRRIRLIVLHRTQGSEEIGSTFTQFAELGRSANYVIDRDGFVIKMVHEQNIPAHVSFPFWRRRSLDVREEAIGIEMVGVSTGTLTPEQYGSLILLIGRLRSRYPLVRSRHATVGHADVQLDKGTCPNSNFEWHTMADAGIGTNFYRDYQRRHTIFDSIVSSRYPAQLGPSLEDAGPLSGWTEDLEQQLRRDLLSIGYSINESDHTTIPVTDPADTRVEQALYVFRSHFLGREVNTKWLDQQTARVLISVLVDLGVVSPPNLPVPE